MMTFPWQMGGGRMQMPHDEELSGTLVKNQTMAVAFQQTADCLTSAYGTKWNGNASATNGSLYAKQSMSVRRLTPEECEALQGFPRGYTDIKPNGKPTPDGPRYKALGNSMATNCMEWIGMRMAEVEEISRMAGEE